jgi:hypothetical protein
MWCEKVKQRKSQSLQIHRVQSTRIEKVFQEITKNIGTQQIVKMQNNLKILKLWWDNWTNKNQP